MTEKAQKKKGMSQRTHPTKPKKIIVKIPDFFKEKEHRLYRELAKCEILMHMTRRDKKMQQKLKKRREEIKERIKSFYIEVPQFNEGMEKLMADIQR